jgi:hypothetical protein
MCLVMRLRSWWMSLSAELRLAQLEVVKWLGPALAHPDLKSWGQIWFAHQGWWMGVLSREWVEIPEGRE